MCYKIWLWLKISASLCWKITKGFTGLKLKTFFRTNKSLNVLDALIIFIQICWRKSESEQRKMQWYLLKQPLKALISYFCLLVLVPQLPREKDVHILNKCRYIILNNGIFKLNSSVLPSSKGYTSQYTP